MALHMMYERMAPEDPMREPTMVNMGLLNMNPSAQRAHPEYEFRTVMATGMSAAPMELVMFHPKAKDEKVAYKRRDDPKLTLSVAMIAPRAAKFKIPRGRFRYLFIGRSKVNLIAANLMNAAIDPVKVIPPIKVPK